MAWRDMIASAGRARLLYGVAIVTITITRNDADILEAFVRHHVELVDAMVVAVHRCGDNSEELLRDLVSEKLPLEILSDNTPDGSTENTIRIGECFSIHPITMHLTQLMRHVASRSHPDWVLPLDSDEFLKVQADRSLTNVLSELPHSQSVAIRWQTYVPTATDPQNELNPVRRITHRRAVESVVLPKILVPANLAVREEFLLSNGHHALFDKRDESIAPMTTSDALFLAHFPVRSEAQLRSKIMSGWLSAAASPTRGSGEAKHWQVLYQRLKNPSPLTGDEIKSIASSYSAEDEGYELIHDPLPTTMQPLQLAAKPVHPWTVLADNAEHLALELARCASRSMAVESRNPDSGDGA
jgi:hypothetical protein